MLRATDVDVNPRPRRGPFGIQLDGHGDVALVAVNGALLADKATFAARVGDEVALLPPVSGG